MRSNLRRDRRVQAPGQKLLEVARKGQEEVASMSSRNAFERILIALQEAALDDAGWQAASGLIDEACGTKGNMLVFGDGCSQDDIELFFARFCYRGQRCEEWERLYFDVYHARDERMPRLRRMPDSHLVHVSGLYSDREKKASPAYNEALPLSHMRDSLNVRMDGPGGSRIVWVMADPVDAEGWSSERVDMIGRLLLHLRQFVCVRQELVEADALGNSLAGLLDYTGAGVIQLDRRGRIVEANDRARDLLRQGDGLFDEGGCLRALSPEDDAGLQRLLARVLPPPGGQGASGSATVRRPTGLARLVLHASPVADRQVDARPRGVAALVLVADPSRRARIDPGMASALLGLTPAESQVAAMLAEGRTVPEIARETGRRESTVRWHLKEIFARHGLARHAELIRLVLSLPDIPWTRP